MRKLNKSMVIGLLVAVMALTTLGGVVLAQDDIAPASSPMQDTFFDKLAQKLGITVDKLKAAFTEAHQDTLDDLVTQGRITAEQRDWRLQRMQERQEQGWGFYGGRRGGCHGDPNCAPLTPPLTQ